jgi:lysophospholipase L1-like esterase
MTLRASSLTAAAFAAAFLCAPQNGLAGNLALKTGDRVAIVGDSITEQKQYSKFMELYLLACVPQLELTMFQFGWSGERAPGFAGRMENDMVWWRPTVVTTCFGMNDGSYRPFEKGIGDAYEAGDRRIEARCKELGARMIVGGPGPVDTDSWKKGEPDADKYYNDNLAKLSGIAERLAKEHGFVFAGLHPLMMKVMQDAKAALGQEYPVCGGDGVHPGANGHLVMAYAFLKAMGLDGDIGTITVDMAGGATATEGHRVVSAEKGAVTVESARYPFCFFGGDKDPNGTRSILPFVPFNRDLNRYTLVVKNLSAPGAEVKWGSASKTFTKAELEAGVNLADAFLDNPFSAPFAALDRVVGEKQSRETRVIKGMITNFRGWAADFPGDAELAGALDTLRRKLADRCAQDAAQARAAVKPVTHTILITPK